MANSVRAPVKFDRPPVLEVACGIAFALPKPLKTAHIGLYWSRVADQFPRCEDAQPIAMVVEGPDAPDSTGYDIQFEAVTLPPLRRVWLLNEPGTHLLQIQEDRFLFNWKRTEQEVTYPSYVTVIAGFREQWASFQEFLVAEGVGAAVPRQLEMTYFNMLSGPKVLRDYARDVTPERFLGEPDAVNWRSVFSLPEGCGRLHVNAATARHAVSGSKGIRLEITARGLPRDTSESSCGAWFDLAHEWITRGFADVTTEDAHKEWGRTA
jgi:uncharacterized protein (TIGR04255 family)